MQQSFAFPDGGNDSAQYLQLGDQLLSPLSYWTLQLLETHITSQTKTIEGNIFWLGFPSNKNSSQFILPGLMTQLFKEDLKVGMERTDLRPGMKVCLFKTELAEYRYITANHLHLTLNRRHDTGYRKTTEKMVERLPAFYIDYCQPYTGSKTRLSTQKKILEKARERMRDAKPIDRLLLGRDAEDSRVRSGILKSKVLVLTGRNNRKKLLEALNEIEIYKTSASVLFDENILLKKDPDEYRNFFSVQERQKREKFRKYFISKLRDFSSSLPDLEAEIDEVEKAWKTGEYHQEQVQDLKNTISYTGKELPQFFDNLERDFPSSNPLPSNLKLVLISDSSIYTDFQNTIQGMAELGIKICIVYSARDCTQMPAGAFSGSPRYFWNREKIKTLGSLEEEVLDEKWFKNNQRYALQDILINIHDDGGISDAYWNLYKEIKTLEGEENLKYFFWNLIFPVYHIIKNSPGVEFQDIFPLYEKLKDFTDENSIFKGSIKVRTESFLKCLSEPGNYKSAGTPKGSWLGQELNFFDSTYKLPYKSAGFVHPIDTPLISASLGGIPVRDFESRFLERILMENMVQNLELTLWPQEFEYFRRFWNRYKTNSLLQDSEMETFFEELPEEFPRDVEDMERVYSILDHRNPSESKSIIEDMEELEEEVSSKYSHYRHSKYQGNPGSYTKKCFVIQLRGDRWIYLPKDESSFVYDPEKQIVLKKKNKEVSRGSLLVLFKLNKEDIRRSGEENVEMDRIFEDLEIWENSLRNLFLATGENLALLKQTLERTKDISGKPGSPEEYNLRRWLDEDDLTLNPRQENLQMILEAAGEGDKLQKVTEASRIIRKYEKKLSNSIRKEVVQMGEVFLNSKEDIVVKDILINGVNVKVTTCKVALVEENAIDVEYGNTRKIKEF